MWASAGSAEAEPWLQVAIAQVSVAAADTCTVQTFALAQEVPVDYTYAAAPRASAAHTNTALTYDVALQKPAV